MIIYGQAQHTNPYPEFLAIIHVLAASGRAGTGYGSLEIMRKFEPYYW
jgi:hypothetical protein